MSDFKGFKYVTLVNNDDPIVKDHQVHGVRIMPGVTLFDMVYKILQAEGYDAPGFELRNIVFKEAIATTAQYDRKIELKMEPVSDYGLITARSLKVKDGQIIDPEWSGNYQAELHPMSRPVQKVINIKQLRAQSSKQVDLEELYGYIRKLEVRHDTFMKGLGSVYQGAGYLLAEIHLSDPAKQYLEYTYLHPVYLDAATIVPLLLIIKNFDAVKEEFVVQKPGIPIYIESFQARSRLWDKCFVFVQESRVTFSPSKDVMYLEIRTV